MYRLWVFCVFVFPIITTLKQHNSLSCRLFSAGVSSRSGIWAEPQIDEQFTAGEPATARYLKIDVRADPGSAGWCRVGSGPPQHTHQSIHHTLAFSVCLSVVLSLPLCLIYALISIKGKGFIHIQHTHTHTPHVLMIMGFFQNCASTSSLYWTDCPLSS